MAALVAIVVSTIVFVRRGAEAWRAGHVAPGAAVTSGCEEESFYALWRVVHGQPVFVDTLRVPYVSSYFNWLFYRGYGVTIAPAVHRAGDAAIPPAGRIVTAVGALVGVGILWWLLRRILAGHTLFAGAIATFVYFGPLVGWWAYTLRPDVWAMTFEVAATALMLVTYRRCPWAAVLVGLLLLNAAWACKQTTVVVLGTAFVFLVIRRQFGLAAVLVAGMAALVGTTVFALGPEYLESQRATASVNAFDVATGLTNLASTLGKSAPLLLLTTAVLLVRRSASPIAPSLAADAFVFGCIGVVLGTVFAFVTSCKVGASSNYYFSVVLLAAFAGAGAISLRSAPRIQLLFCFAAVGIQLLVLFGVVGRISLADQAESLGREWSVYRTLPEPRFTADFRLNQPWLSPHSPPFVLAFNYALLHRAGAKFEGGGIGAMIDRGEFASLLLPVGVDSYYGGHLDRYSRDAQIGDFIVYRRKSTRAEQ